MVKTRQRQDIENLSSFLIQTINVTYKSYKTRKIKDDGKKQIDGIGVRTEGGVKQQTNPPEAELKYGKNKSGGKKGGAQRGGKRTIFR